MSKAHVVLVFMTFNVAFLSWYLVMGQIRGAYRRRVDKPLIALVRSPVKFRFWQAFRIALIAVSGFLWAMAFGEVR